jgi:membrane protein DedA with SNARE-associated domain
MDSLSHLQLSSALSYVLAVVIPALDAVFPVLPSVTVVIALGVSTAGSADPRIFILVALAAAGAFLGDNLSYMIGRRFSPWVHRHFFSGEKGEKRREWAEGTLEHYGARLIVVCRFIPGGRTAVTLTCGSTRYDRFTFVWATALAGVIWACYAFFLGRIGGKTFADREWLGLLLAFGAALGVSALVELGRRLPGWWRGRRRRRA